MQWATAHLPRIKASWRQAYPNLHCLARARSKKSLTNMDLLLILNELYSLPERAIIMKYSNAIQSSATDPEQLENLYQGTKEEGYESEFRADLNDLYIQNPHNLLFAAWYHRFLRNPLTKAVRRIPWILAIVIGLFTGLTIWAISDPGLLIQDHIPAFGLLWSPIASIFCLIYLAVARKKDKWHFILPGLILLLATGYVLLAVRGQARMFSNTYIDQMAIHLPLLCWICLGLALTGFHSGPQNRFAFLIKSIEVGVAAGLFLIFGVALGAITMILFTTLEVAFPDTLLRLIGFGGFGLLPILAVATMYDPTVSPQDQDFNQGLSKFIIMLMRLLLPLALLVLVVYIFFIPFNFMAPFNQRDVLIVFNVVLFAIMGLLIGATPLQTRDISPRLQTALRTGIIAVACLAALVSIYAMAAVVYRSSDGMTMNRLTVIGWNTINLSIFLSIIYHQWRRGTQDWSSRLHLIFNRAAIFYAVWTVFTIFALPLFYR
jgi:hypothetical protein